MMQNRARLRWAIGVAALALVLSGGLLVACVGASGALPSFGATPLLPVPAATPAAAGALPVPAAGLPAGVPGERLVTAPANAYMYLPAAMAAAAAPAPVSCPPITGWQGLYWNNPTLSGNTALCRDDANLSFNWGAGSPDPAIPADGFSARWTRRVTLAAGRYRFRLAGDDGVRLWIDDSLVIDHWQVQARTEYVADRDLFAGPHELRIEYFENVGLAALSFSWELLPNTCPAYQAEYYNNATLAGDPVFLQCEGWVLDRDWGSAGPGHGLGGENFSVRWTGRAHLAAGTYTFVADTDDGMRAWLNGELIVDAWRDQALTEYRVTRTLKEGDYDLRVEYYQRTQRAVARFYWLLRTTPTGILISQRQGFDICRLPPVDQMLTWWNKSPYWEANIYLGGVLSFCDQPNLTKQNLIAMHGQGWNFIPTWVGPQAPCSNYATLMSSDADTAHDEGRSEADAAAAVARSLGLTELGGAGGSTIVYYDLEYYHTEDAACRATVASFMSGWVERLHELGLRAGAYASPCGGYMADWATVSSVPDDVWPAAWTDRNYNANASVWGLGCLPDSLWPDHQRLHQYAGGHDETWGGLTLNVDSNVIDGHVAGDNLRPVSPTISSATRTPNLPPGEGGGGELAVPELQAARLLPSGEGWAVNGSRLLWTADRGGQWMDITPAAATGRAIRAAFFLDAQHGWLLLPTAGASAGQPQPEFLLARTSDGGRTWSTAALAGLDATDANITQSPANFDFSDAQTGWLALTLPTGSNFSRGLLFATTDGGQTWRRLSLPIGGKVRFSDGNTGWVAGGAAGDQLYVTRDGSRTWQLQTPVAGLAAGEHAAYAVPTFSDALHGVLPVTISGGQDPRVELYRTADRGQSWQKSGTVALAGRAAPGAAVPAAALSGLDLMLADPATGRLWSSAAGSGAARPMSASAALQGVTDLQFTAGGQGWALVQSGDCSGNKAAAGAAVPAAEPFRCAARRALLSTADGGASWQEVGP